MKQFLVLLFVYGFPIHCTAQSFAGVTGIPDTSYTTLSAFRSTSITHPDIKIVEELHSTNVVEKRGIVYCTLDSRSLLLDVFYPKKTEEKKRTAILILHGGGWRTGNRTQHYPLAQRLADLGYVCFTPEYRLSTEALYPAAIHDVKSAVRWIRKNARLYHIDTNRIVVFGFSAGGELAAFVGATNSMEQFEGKGCYSNFSSQVQAVIDVDGILSFVHPESGEGDDRIRTSAATHWFGYPKHQNLQLWTQASALTHVGRHTPPTLFINSAVDRMHAGREEFIKILNGFNIYTEVIPFENAPHSFCLFSPWFEPTVRHIESFLNKVFPD